MNIKDKIHEIRGKQVMLDSDLAYLYEVETKDLNKAVKRNKTRFPENFMFQITVVEYEELNSKIANNTLRFQNGTSSHGGRRYLPYAFTEQGVSMLSAVLRSKKAIDTSIQIINAFVTMRHFLAQNTQLFQRVDRLEIKQLETDNQLKQVFDAIEERKLTPSKGIFFDGQVFDAYKFISDLVRSAEESITLIDNYVDESTLSILSKKKTDVKITIYTKEISKQFYIDIKKFGEQYEPITVIEFGKSHDRFLIIDKKEIYHIGASLKDLGKKWFAFSKLDKESLKLLENLDKQTVLSKNF